MDEKKKMPFKSLDTIEHPENGGISYALIGSTRSGKSTCMLWLWERYFKKHITLLTTQSSHASIYGPLKSKCVIIPEFAPDIISETMKINVATKNKYDFCHIFDDCVSGKNNKTLQKLLCIGRNAAQSVVYCGQEITLLNAVGRSNINFILCFKLNSDISVEKMVKNWLRHSFPSHMKIHEMIQHYHELTKDHHCIVVNTLTGEIFQSKISPIE